MFREQEEKSDFQKSPVTFFAKLFRWKRMCLKRTPPTPSLENGHCNDQGTSNKLSCSVTCIPSNVSVNDVMITTYPPSPALSIPIRIRDMNQDLQALRLSRQDDPFLKVLASKESLVESFVDESGEQDEINPVPSILLPDMDPLSVPEFHKHMVRSPPPVNWPRSPIFRFDDSSQESLGARRSSKSCHYSRESMFEGSPNVLSPSLGIPPHGPRSSSTEAKDRRSSSFSLTPMSLRSLSEVRRFHTKSCEESQQLVTST